MTQAQEVGRGGPPSKKKLRFSSHPHSTLDTPICTWSKAFAPMSAQKWLRCVLYKWGWRALVSFLVPS